MSSCIKKISLSITAVALFMGNITLPSNINYQQFSKKLNSGWNLGFKKAHADECPMMECIPVTGTTPERPALNIDWGDYDWNPQGSLSANRDNAYSGMTNYILAQYADQIAAMKEENEKRQKELEKEQRKEEEQRIKKCKEDVAVEKAEGYVWIESVMSGSVFACQFIKFGNDVKAGCVTVAVWAATDAKGKADVKYLKMANECI
ncbi:MAG: hypothetical protein HRT37_11445 [Alteromonadaceae bacterium]|nr:hypothetical protein [Alteromonadaceae bacterium]